MTIKPLGERVLVKMDKVEEKTAGGIFIPQTAQEKKGSKDFFHGIIGLKR